MSTLRIAPFASALLLLVACSDPAAAGPSGLVSLTQTEVAGTTQQVLFGYFADDSLDALRSGELSGCALVEQVGSCRRFECDGAVAVTHDVGELTVRGADGTLALSAAVNASAGAYSAVSPGAGLVPGELVTFEATGGAVPAFMADVVVPRAPTVVLPASIARTAPLTLSWSDTDAATMQLALVPTTRAPIIRCLTAGSAATLTVDPALLDDYAPGTTLLVTTSAFTSTEVRAGAYALDVSVAHGTTATATVE